VTEPIREEADMPSQEAVWPTPFNVVASFPRGKQAREARDLLVQEGVPAAAVSVIDRTGPAANATGCASPAGTEQSGRTSARCEVTILKR
jgi:hypothetical protein